MNTTWSHWVFKWLAIALLVGVVVGTASAFFLLCLDGVTKIREAHSWLLFLLPVAGWVIGWSYHSWAGAAQRGNNLLFEVYYQPKDRIPGRMAPFILISTLLTHLVGGSAGREGTAVQMGGSLADQLGRWWSFSVEDRRLVLLLGISTGFSAVFGTPLAGVLFALEVLPTGREGWRALVPMVVATLVADQVCLAWTVVHTPYTIGFLPDWTLIRVGWVLLAGVLFGLVARLYAFASHWITGAWSRLIPFPPLRPFFGGWVLLFLFLVFDLHAFAGLGIPSLVASFQHPMEGSFFILKLALTVVTLSVGFKGGEVTPLFVIGATLGSALSTWVPLPTAFMAGLGFVAVFAGATKTPLACMVMGMELMGMAAGPWLGVATFVSFLFSGKTSIYSAQKTGWWRAWMEQRNLG